MKNNLVPAVWSLLVLFVGGALIFMVTLRPWASADESYDTHLNFKDGVPATYSRTDIAWVSNIDHAPKPWVPSAAAAVNGRVLFVTLGCASCHGLDARGSWVGGDVTDLDASKIVRQVRRGPGGMPAYHDLVLTDEQVNFIVDYLAGLQPVETPTPGDGTITPTPQPSPTATPFPTATPTPTTGNGPMPTPTAKPSGTQTLPSGPISLQAAWATISVDGDASDWAAIPGTKLTLTQIKPIPGVKMGKLDPVVVTLKIAADSQKLYLLMEVSDDYKWVSGDPYMSGKMAVMFRIDDPAASHMGTTEEEQKKSLGLVDIWHWSLDCGARELSGGGGVKGGKDAKCALDDEWATTPSERKDDNTAQAENSLSGVWEHTGRTGGPGSPGIWVFELSRPLVTGDPQDAQFVLGGKAYLALAYWDPDENRDGWTEAGHLQSSSLHDWIQVILPEAQ
ncbi:MAG: c-type cytochrome [Chloroflexi bacterium]|nr:c-type cytochrome [Chloroflexota bacterium]